MRPRLLAISALVTALVLAGTSCSRGAERAPAPSPPADPLAQLRAFEEARRAEAHFLETPAQDRGFGADPYDVATMHDGRVAGILRGRDALVVLDADLREVARVAAPRSPSAVAVYGGPPAGVLRPGDVLVASEIEPVLAHYRPSTRDEGRAIERLADVPLDDVIAARDVATGPEGVVHVVEEHDGRLVTLRFTSRGIERHERTMPRGPLRLARTRTALFVASPLEHTIAVLPVDRRGVPAALAATATIDGPYWSLAALETADGKARIVAGGVEDHPLDRRGGFFGFIDSFVYVYTYRLGEKELRRTAAINVSEQGLIVPKAIAFADDGSALVTSYGSANAVRLSWRDGVDAPPSVSGLASRPGISAIVRAGARFVAADPLLDAWVAIGDGSRAAEAGLRVVRVEDGDDRRSDRERIGEALFFTGLMAPSSSSDGAKSRFSCETCHFEGYVDGRVHHTGRGDVHATTKPLVGLFNNRPHFSRALDPDLSAVAENEFRVAGAPSPVDPHFDVDARDVPWLGDLAVRSRHYDATELRLSLMAFLMSWTHRTNPRAASSRAFTGEERAGAVLFRDRCERCHQARAAADDPGSRVELDRWESLVLGGHGPLVWGSDAYEKTGIVPYVHERGARVPSLRRVYKKRPYFTNGSAPDIASVLRRARFDEGGRFSHDGGAGTSLDEPSVRALAAFIDLL